jgi:hypothetical protein
MPKKKSISNKSYEFDLPPGVIAELMDNGDLHFTIETNLVHLSCSFNPENIKQALHELVTDLFQENRGRKYPDCVIYSGSEDTVLLVEAKRGSVNAPKVDGLSEKDIKEEQRAYVDRAWNNFRSTFIRELQALPSKHLVLVMNSTIGALDSNGLLLTKTGAASLINGFFGTLLDAYKARTPTKRRGRSRKLMPSQERGYEQVYTDTLRELQSIKNELDNPSEDSEEDSIESCKKKYFHIPENIIKGLEFDPASTFSHRLAAQRYGVEYGRYLEDVVRRVRLHKKDKSKTPSK